MSYLSCVAPVGLQPRVDLTATELRVRFPKTNLDGSFEFGVYRSGAVLKTWLLGPSCRPADSRETLPVAGDSAVLFGRSG